MKIFHCVPPSPDVMSKLYSDYFRITQGQGITFAQYLAIIGYSNPADNSDGMDDAASLVGSHEHGLELIAVPDKPISGQLNVMVLLVDFPDLQGSLPASHYDQLLFSKNTYPTGSMRDYYREVSLGKVDISGSIHGWLRLPNNYSYYTNGESGLQWNSYPRNAPRMVEDAVRAALDAGIGFDTKLDALDENKITALFVIHAGLGAESQSLSTRNDHIWSHKWVLRNPIEVFPNLLASTYLTVPHDCKVGVCAHELGHLAFQWEDFYDPNYGQDGQEWDGSGKWDLMAGGSYNGNGNRPAHPAGLHKSQHHWVNTTEVKSSGQFTLKPYTDNTGDIIKILSPKYRDGQYLLLENRSKNGFDSDLPGEGLLVWKVDESADMFGPDKPALLLIQADGRRQLQTPNDWNTGDAGDPFPGSSNRTELNDQGIISTSFPDGEDSGVSLKNILRNPDTNEVTFEINFEGDGASNSELIRLTATPNTPIPDNDTTGVKDTLDVNKQGIIRQIAVSVDIVHTYIGDLQVELISPSNQTIALHSREGSSADNLKKTYSSVSSSVLAELIGANPAGKWTLRVADLAGADLGTLKTWTLAIDLDKADSSIKVDIKPNLNIPDNDPTGIASVLRVSRAGMARNLKVHVDITHTYIGDLRVELINPQGTRAILHNKLGGQQDNLVKTFESANTDALAPLIGGQINGDWTLRVLDLMGNDVGTLNSWGMEIELTAQLQQVKKENSQVRSIPDSDTAGISSSLNFTESGTLQALAIEVDVTHTYIGDLRVELIAPSGKQVILHNQTGGRTKNLLLQLSSAAYPELSILTGEPISGNWILRIADLESLDTGTLNRWSLQLSYSE